MESHENKSKVFRQYYGRLKDCFNCSNGEVATLLYTNRLISAEVRDSKDANTMLAALEKVLAVKEEAWETLIIKVMIEPPLSFLAPKMTKELEEENLASERRWSRELGRESTLIRVSNADIVASSSNGYHSHPTSLPFNSETTSKYPPIDSGNWSSDKSQFPSNYFNQLDPSIPSTIDEHDSNTAPDSGIILLKDNPNGTRELDEAMPTPPTRGSSDDSVQQLMPQVVQSVNGTTRSEMVNPVGETKTLTRNTGPNSATPTSTDCNNAMILRDLQNEIATLKQKLTNSNEECDGLKAEIDIANDRRIEDSKLLERKLKQLSDDNELLSKQCAERRQLESENRRLLREVKKCKSVIKECESDIDQLKTCLKIAERNAWVQSVTIDKLRVKVAEQEVAFTEYKNTELKDKMFAMSSHNADSSPPSYY